MTFKHVYPLAEMETLNYFVDLEIVVANLLNCVYVIK